MNYLSIINKEYLKEPYSIDYGPGRGVFNQKLYRSVLLELKIDIAEIGSFTFLNEIKDQVILKKMINNLCENINKLSSSEAHSMILSGVMSVIIMEIWSSLKKFYNENERELALKDLLELIKNEVVIKEIKSMDLHFKQHHFRDDPSKSQF